MKKTVRIAVATIVASAIFAAFFAGCGDAGSGVRGQVNSIEVTPISAVVAQGGVVLLDVIVKGERLGDSVPLIADVFVLDANVDASGNRRIGDRTLAGVILSGDEALPYGQDKFRTTLTLKLPREADPDYDITVIVHSAARGAVNAGGRTDPISVSEMSGEVGSVQITGSGNAHRDSSRGEIPSPFVVTVNWDVPPGDGVSDPNAVWWTIVGGAVHDGGPSRNVAAINAETGALTIPRGQRPGYLRIRATSRYGHEYVETGAFRVNHPEVTGITISAPPPIVRRGEGADITAAFSGVGYPQDYYSLARPSNITWSVAGSRESIVTPTSANNLSARLDVSRWERLNSIRVWVTDAATGSMLSDFADIDLEGAQTRVGAFIEVAAGDFHVLARDWDYGLWAWGRNDFGQIGIGSAGWPVTTPTQVGIHTDWTQISGGELHSFGIRRGGTLWAWGRGGRGSLGLGPAPSGVYHVAAPNSGAAPPDVHSPAQVMAPGSSTWVSASAGLSFGVAATFNAASLGIAADGVIWTWGTNTWGQSGVGNQTTNINHLWTSPRRALMATGGTRWRSVDAGRVATVVAISNDGFLYTWGANHTGELGQNVAIGGQSFVATPTRVLHPDNPNTTWLSASAGLDFMVAVDVHGVMWSWGSNQFATLGIRFAGEHRNVPVRVIFPEGENPRFTQVSISQGAQHVLAIDREHRLWAWGRNNYGQIGSGFGGLPGSVSLQFLVTAESGGTTITQWRSANAGHNFSVAVSRHSNPDHDGIIFTWGNNHHRQMGNPALTADFYTTPQRLNIQR